MAEMREQPFDAEPAWSPGDDLVDWSRVGELQARVDVVNAIEDPTARSLAARELTAELAGGE